MQSNTIELTFAEYFTDIFNESGKTITEVANDLCVDDGTVYRWLNGQRIPKLSRLSEISEYFNIDEEVLVYTIINSTLFKRNGNNIREGKLRTDTRLEKDKIEKRTQEINVNIRSDIKNVFTLEVMEQLVKLNKNGIKKIEKYIILLSSQKQYRKR